MIIKNKLNRAVALTLLLANGLLGVNAQALDLKVGRGYSAARENTNVGGGLSYLPDGDILAFSSDYANGPALYIYDANKDGFPKGGKKELAQFDSSTFSSFVRVSPNGAFALAGVSGVKSEVLKVDLKTNTIKSYFNAPGNYDLVFIDNTKGYLSSNPGGFDPATPNIISLVKFTSTPTISSVAEITNTPSGPITVNRAGDLYYIKGTYTFPAPANSSVLLKFSAQSLANALNSKVPLKESDSTINVALNGGYNLVFNGSNSLGRLFISAIGNQILKLNEGSTMPEVFLTVSDPTSPSLTGIAMLNPFGRFAPSGRSSSALGLSLATNFFSDYSFLQIKPKTFEREFSTSLTPKLTVVDAGNRTLKISLEKITQAGLSYRISVAKAGSKAKIIETKSSSIRLTKLARAKYQVSYRIITKSGNRTVQSRASSAVTVELK
jgi:hypothetical protein